MCSESGCLCLRCCVKLPVVMWEVCAAPRYPHSVLLPPSCQSPSCCSLNLVIPLSLPRCKGNTPLHAPPPSCQSTTCYSLNHVICPYAALQRHASDLVTKSCHPLPRHFLPIMLLPPVSPPLMSSSLTSSPSHAILPPTAVPPSVLPSHC